ncbi:MAG TPA: FAD-dependent oxidoreductase, partial [Chitinophagaceae bacterium]
IIRNFGQDGAKLVAQATKDAIALVNKNIADHGIDCGYEDASAYLFSQNKDQSEELDEIHDASAEVGIDVAYHLSLPVKIAFEKVMEVRGQGKFHPARYVHALAREFEALGGVVLEDTRVEGIEDTDGLTVETNAGKFRAANVIYATHTPPGINLIHLRTEPWRSYAMAATLRGRNYPEDLTYDMYDPYHYIRTQIIDGRRYLVVGGEDHKTGQDVNEETSFLKLESYMRKHFDIERIDYRWSSQYFESADGLPYIGHLPGHPGNLFVASGFGGNGITYGNVSALVLRDMIMDRESKYVDLFNPNRIKPVAGFTTFVKHNVDVLKKFIDKWFDREQLTQLAGIAPGEARVIRFDGEKIALYKDQNGELFAVSPICTHMKCSVAWNETELSWDCPCHGSRFSFDGKVLTGPADHDLQKIALKDLVEH